MIDQRDSLAREVDEELRREQMLKLWEKYGTYVVAAIALIVVGVGGVKYYQYRTTVAAEAAGARLAEATRRSPPESGAQTQKILEDIGKSGPAGYATLARFRLAAADREAGKLAEAAAAYEAIANAGAGDRLLADYARLQAASSNWIRRAGRTCRIGSTIWPPMPIRGGRARASCWVWRR